MLKIPYGIRDFDKLVSNDFVYLDRTDRIHTMERLGYELLFLRPRRFGKSLWLSTLMNYYDINRAADFERLFGPWSIGQNPTPNHNQYLVMKWDFSNIESFGTIREIRQSLYNHINAHIERFAFFYKDRLARPINIIPDDALKSFDSLLTSVAASKQKLYLFIDEYDNFANEVMMAPSRRGSTENQERYHDLVSGEGLLKTLFLALLHYNQLYMMDSEPALNRSYGDLLLMIRPEMRHYQLFDLLLEFKYVGLERLRQDHQKITGQRLRQMDATDILALDVVQRKVTEATVQLQTYHQALAAKYGSALKLRSYAVIGIGVERLVWVAVEQAIEQDDALA